MSPRNFLYTSRALTDCSAIAKLQEVLQRSKSKKKKLKNKINVKIACAQDI